MTPESRLAILAACIYLPLGLGCFARRLDILDAHTNRLISRTAILTLEPIKVLVGRWLLATVSAAGALLVPVIDGAMPVAIFATVVSNFFGLDRDLANSAWVVTTPASAQVIPVLYLFTR